MQEKTEGSVISDPCFFTEFTVSKDQEKQTWSILETKNHQKNKRPFSIKKYLTVQKSIFMISTIPRA